MKKLFTKLSLLFALSAFTGTGLYAQTYTAHEWGTFTTLQSSEGKMLPGLYLEEEPLPSFVYSHKGFTPDPGTQKGLYKPCDHVTVKMETPVIYFYSEQEMDVSVKVGFPGGSISQWFPQRTDGEKAGTEARLDFSRPYNGWISWNTKILAPNNPAQLSHTQTSNTWEAPRATDANLVQTGTGETEKYLFYRGVGNFSPGITTRFLPANELSITNGTEYDVPFFFVYEMQKGKPAKVYWTGSLSKGMSQKIARNYEMAAANFDQKLPELEKALIQAGLYEKEAKAMLNTWKHSYFGTPGLRVFYVVPRAYTDKILPLDLQPAPQALERVIIGRNEVLTPEFEKELADDINSGNFEDKWSKDRYYLAYQARAEEIKNTTSVSGWNGKGLEKVTVYPNPTRQQLSVEVTGIGAFPVTISLETTNGKVIKTENIRQVTGTVNTQFDISALSQGIYVLRVNSGKRVLVRNIVKE